MKRPSLPYSVAACVSLLTFLVYLKALGNDFVGWDDNEYVFDNPHIRSFDFQFLRWAFFDFYAANWHPLTWISHALDWAIWGSNPLGHHLTNNILHAVNTFLVVLLVVKLVEAARKWMETEGGAGLTDGYVLVTAAATGLLFGIHPIHVESVAWVSERKDLVCALFYLLSVLQYLSYRSNMALRGLLFSLLFFAFALMSKPMAVSLPVVLLILDWYPLRRIDSVHAFRTAFVEKLPFLALGLGASILTMKAQEPMGALSLMAVTTPWTRTLVAAHSIVAYLWKMIVPLNLSPFYSYPEHVSFLSLQYFLPVALVISTTVVCILLAGRQRVWMSAWAYYLVTLAPVLGIVQAGSQAMADRYMYLPCLGPFLLIGLGAARGLDKRPASGSTKKVTGRELIAATMAIVVFASMVYLTIRQMAVWSNTVTLWTYVIEKEPERGSISYNGRSIAYYNLACWYAREGNTGEACELLRKSVENGYQNWDHIVNDPDFDKIRISPCYREIVDRRNP